MDTVGIRGPTRQIKEFSTFIVSHALGHSPSARCVIAANDICRYLGIFGKKHLFDTKKCFDCLYVPAFTLVSFSLVFYCFLFFFIVFTSFLLFSLLFYCFHFFFIVFTSFLLFSRPFYCFLFFVFIL
jgi:hypothetical protein